MTQPAPAATPVGVNVLLDRSRPSAAVVDDLAAAGLNVERVLGSLDVVSGTVPSDRMAGLAEVDGVTAVERDRPVSATRRPA